MEKTESEIVSFYETVKCQYEKNCLNLTTWNGKFSCNVPGNSGLTAFNSLIEAAQWIRGYEVSLVVNKR